MGSSKTEDFLAPLFAESHKREVDADEAIWRSMPFFAAVIGLAVAVLPAIYRSASQITSVGWSIVVGLMFAVSVGCFVVAGWWFRNVIRRRDYRYPPTDAEVLQYARMLEAFYKQKRTSAAERDEAIRDDLRALMISEFAHATSNNRRNNIAKAQARSQVLLFVMTGFLFAFLCEGTILAAEALSPHIAQGDIGDRYGQPNEARNIAGEACTTPTLCGSGGSGISPARREAVGKAAGMSDGKPPTPSPSPSPQKPAPPQPEIVKKNDQGLPRERR